MRNLIEKWKPIMEYRDRNGYSVPECDYKICAECLEKTINKIPKTEKHKEKIPYFINLIRLNYKKQLDYDIEVLSILSYK